MHTTLFKSLCVVAFAVTIPAACALSAPENTSDNSLEDLGESLLNDASLSELLKRGDDAPSKPDQPGSRLAPPDFDDLRRLLDPNRQAMPPEGEDLGKPSQRTSPLVGISEKMSQASELIASQTTTGETQEVQNSIVSELDALIERLNKQCKKCSGGQCKKPGQQQTQSATPKPGQGKPANSQGNTSAPTQSQVSSGGGGDAQPGAPSDAEVVKQLWGQLPERLRQQLMRSSADEFLPKYREDLEAYFRELADQHQSEQ